MSIWVAQFGTKFDESDGEPLCQQCDSCLESKKDDGGTITVRCVIPSCLLYQETILKASSYDEITEYFLAKYHELSMRRGRH
jgi:hypothetical protein